MVVWQVLTPYTQLTLISLFAYYHTENFTSEKWTYDYGDKTNTLQQIFVRYPWRSIEVI